MKKIALFYSSLSKRLFVILSVILMAASLWPSVAMAAGSDTTVSASSAKSSLKGNPIIQDLKDVVNFLAAGVGIVVIANVILGGIQYSMAGGNADGVGKAKTRITNALLALLAFLLMYGFLQWIIPGGVFNSS